MRPRPLDVLLAPAPLAALGVLLLNDFVLKARFGGFITGKLSDFAGLFLFAVFWMALFPRRREAVALAVGAAWIAWKSLLATPLIEAWNAAFAIDIGRVVDPGDLAALVMLPLALRQAAAPRPALSGALRPAAVLLSTFAFAATTIARPGPYPLARAEYDLAISRAEVLDRIYTLRLDYADPGVPPFVHGDTMQALTITLPPRDSGGWEGVRPWDGPEIRFSLTDRGAGTELRLWEARGYTLTPRDTLVALFRRRVVDRINRNEPNPFTRPPVVAGAARHYRPRILAPRSLAEPRGQVIVSLSRPAYPTVISVTPDDEWHVIASGLQQTPAGISTVATTCAGSPDPPGCAVTEPLRASRPPPPGTTPRPGRLIVLATDAPLNREALQALVGAPEFERQRSVDWPGIQSALGRLVRQAGGRRAAAIEVLLRR